MFGAIFNAGGGAIDPARLGDGPAARDLPRRAVKSFEGHFALLDTRANPSSGGEDVGIQNLDGRVWLVGRIRLDDRDELVRRLSERGVRHVPSDPDAVLCLQAYDVWGDRFVDYLFGDFSFLLWDAGKRKLIGVVDRLGTHALFHARAGDCWVIGDRLEWVASQAGALGELDDYWVADFLSVGQSRELERTVYKGVRRLAPAHLVMLSETGVAVQRYWRLDIDEPLLLPNDAAYVERFLELLRRSIADRLPPEPQRVGISLSGGLDSTLIAACSVDVLGGAARIVADCEHYETLMHIGERDFAALAARRLGIDLRVRSMDREVYDPEWRTCGIRTVEPTPAIMNATNRIKTDRECAALATVWFHGEGPDTALWFERDAYLSWLLQRRRWRELGTALARYVTVKGVGGWVQSFRRHFGGPQPASAYYGPDHLPLWLDRGFVERLRLAERAEQLGFGGEGAHPWHPQAVAALTSPLLQQLFSDYVGEEQSAPISWRYPFLDLRVLEFMFSVPPIPWGWKKHLMRRAGCGLLPDEVLRREKTSLPLDPDLAVLRRHGLPSLMGPDEIARYVDVTALPGVDAPDRDLRCMNALLALDYWLAGGRL